MEIQTVRNAFGYCALINIAFMIMWMIIFMCGRRWIYRVHGKWFAMSEETFNAIHYGGMAAYKIIIFVLNLVPYLALWLAAR